MRTKLLTIVFCLVVSFAQGQGWDISYGVGTHVRAIAQCDDGGFMVAGWNFYMKIDPAGTILWSVPNQTDYYSIHKASDGNFLLAGKDSNNVTRVIKINDAGTRLYNMTYLSGTKSCPSTITELDGNYIITGHVTDAKLSKMPLDSTQTFLLKTNTSGTLIWSKIYNKHSATESSTGYAVKLDTDQNYLLWGHRRLIYNHGGQMMKINALSGDTIWTLQMNSGSTNNSPPTPVVFKGVTTADGGYVSSGDGIGGVFDYGFCKYNSSYQVEWSKVINIEDQNHTYNVKTVAQTPDGGYITGGINFAMAPLLSPPYIAKFSSTGDTIWTQPITGTQQGLFESVTAVLVCQDGYLFGVSISGGGVRLIRTGDKPTNNIKGQFYVDANGNCVKDPGEEGAPFGKVMIQPGNLIAGADTAGNYSIAVREGTYTVTAIASDLWEADCSGSSHTVTFSTPYTDYLNADIALSAVKNCSRLVVDISTPLQRRCFRNMYTVSYSNEGTIATTNTNLELEFNQEIIPLSFSASYSQVGSKYIIPLGLVNPGQRGTIRIVDSISCNTAFNATVCAIAKINPGNNCEPISSGWDHSSIQVTGKCQGDTAVRFTIINHGQSMAGTSEYKVYKDDVYLYQQTFQLSSLDSLVVLETSDGSTIRLEANQRPEHPGLSMPNASIEGCSSLPVNENSRGFITTLPIDDLDDTIEIDCKQVIGSYDPNDKSVQPAGLTTNNFIQSNNQLEYMIRFQNTGTDTAFTVKIIDTISTELDFSTLVMSGASHNYQYSIRDNEITWVFNNILLPDSNVNLLGSNGFIKYKIKPKTIISEGAAIHNTGYIYFDYNPAVATNTATLRINNSFRTTPIRKASNNEVEKINNILVYPNPANMYSTITVNGISNGTLIVYNAAGLAVLQMPMQNGKVTIDKSKLENGIYMVRVTDEKGFSGAAKMVIE